MNTKSRKKSDVPKEDTPLMLDHILDLFQNGDLDLTQKARPCYLTEQHRAANHITWIHNDELQGHITLRKMGKQSSKDLLRLK